MHRNHGTTLVELVLVLSILATILAFAVPAMSHWVENYRVETLRKQLIFSLNHARNQAVTHAKSVTVCPGDGMLCTDSWNGQLLVFIDENSNGIRENPDTLLSTSPLQLPPGRLAWRSFRGTDYLQFEASGMTPALNGTLTFCHDNKAIEGFALAVARTGRVRIRPPSCS